MNNTRTDRRPTENPCAPAGDGAAQTRPVPWRTVGVIAAASALCATLTWTVIGPPLGGVDMTVHDQVGTRDVGVLAVIVSSLLVAFVGGALLRWWQPRTPTGTRRWTIAALTVAVLSMVGPTSADTLQDGMALVSLHAVVAAIVIVGLTRSRKC